MKQTNKPSDEVAKNIVSVSKTVNAIAVHTVSLVTDMEEMKNEVKEIKQTLNCHTNTLDQLVKQTKDWNTEMVMVRARLDRHDQWFKKIAERVNVTLEV